MAPVQPRLLKGFRDFLPQEQAGRSKMLDSIARAFQTCGFAPISTPAIEYADILLGKYGEDGEKLLYQFEDNGGRKVALRYDLTVPLARVVAQYQDLPRPFKRYQLGTVWRAEKPAHGRFREFMQMDADIVGTADPLADADCVYAGILGLKSLGLDRFTVKIGHRGVLDEILNNLGVTEIAVRIEVLRILDKIDKIGPEAVSGMLEGLGSSGLSAPRELISLIQGAGVDGQWPMMISQEGKDALSHLIAVIDAISAMGFGSHVVVDLTIARGLDYYTGTVFETTLNDLESVGSVMSGGRYDSLLDTYGLADVPAVGISIGIDRLFAALDELGNAPKGTSGPVAVVCLLDRNKAVMSAGLAALSLLRGAEIPSETVPEPGAKLKKQLTYCNRRSARFALIIGEDEASAGKVVLKNLVDGNQESVEPAELIDLIRGTGVNGVD